MMQTVVEFRPNLHLINVQLDGYAVRGAVIIGEKQAVVWDTLAHPHDMTNAEKLIGDKPFHIVYTHADWDHVWGTGGITDAPISIIAHEHCLERFSTDVPQTLHEKQAKEPGTWDSVTLVPPTQTFTSHLTLDLGWVTLTLHHIPGHTMDCLIGWIPEWGVFLGGDVIETPFPVVNAESPVRAWMQALEAWATRPDLQSAIPAHGDIGGRDLLLNNVRYLKSLYGESDYPLPQHLDDFYRITHTENIQHIRGR